MDTHPCYYTSTVTVTVAPKQVCPKCGKAARPNVKMFEDNKFIEHSAQACVATHLPTPRTHLPLHLPHVHPSRSETFCITASAQLHYSPRTHASPSHSPTTPTRTHPIHRYISLSRKLVSLGGAKPWMRSWNHLQPPRLAPRAKASRRPRHTQSTTGNTLGWPSSRLALAATWRRYACAPSSYSSDGASKVRNAH